MDDALKNMINNLEKSTSKPLDFFAQLILEKNFVKHGEAVNFLKTEHGLGHGYANMIVHLAKENSSLHINDEELLATQYKGKEHWLPLYNQLVEFIQSFGNDVEFSPKKAYVSLRRAKQFGLLMPATKTRYEIGLNLKVEGQGALQVMKKGSMCSHKIDLNSSEDFNETVKEWLKQAYDLAQ